MLLLAWYIIDDPFMLYWSNEHLFEYGQRKQCGNDAYRGIRWMDQYDDTMHYNSFIVGSSRSGFYNIEDWKPYLADDASCFHFSQNGDNLLGSWQRIKYLYNRFDRIDNILLVMDPSFIEDMKPHRGHLFMQPWQVTGRKDFMEFNREHIVAFFSWDYQKRLWGLTNEDTDLHYYYIPEYNELHKDGAEALLDSLPEAYYACLDVIFPYDRSGIETISEPKILEEQCQALIEIRDLFVSHHTDYRIVISPMYDQVKLNPQDLQFLNETFGEDKVFDFSGINEYTNDVSNYYEKNHYRPKLCKRLLERLYLSK